MEMTVDKSMSRATDKTLDATPHATTDTTPHKKDVVIVGGGPAGLAAAVKLYENGVRDILILERERHLGGILRQCIHDGFGQTRFRAALTGPEYAERFIHRAAELGIPCQTGTTVLDISPQKEVTAVSPAGLTRYQARAVILTMGCRERTRGALAIPGERPAGVFTAGAAQAYMNLYNRMPAREAVILGSGDIGMIMARRLTLEGAHVKAVFEIRPYASGLPRNVAQCLDDYGIPLYLSHTVTEIHGDARLTGVTVSRVDERLQPIPWTDKFCACDTLILSVGLIPENELSSGAGVILDSRTGGAVVDEYLQTGLEGVFAAGNVLHVHDLVDYVSLEAERLADGVTRYINDGRLPDCPLEVLAGDNIGYTVPQKISGIRDVTLSMRVKKPLRNCVITVCQNRRPIASRRLLRALPAEMVQIPVKAGDISGTGPLSVSAEGDASP